MNAQELATFLEIDEETAKDLAEATSFETIEEIKEVTQK
jgi:hypothetical protein